MLRYRFLSALVLIPPVVGLIFWGGGWFLALVAVVITLSGYEYANITRHGGAQSSAVLIVGFSWLALLAAYLKVPALLWPGTMLFTFVALTWALFRFERGAQTAVVDWVFTLAGGLYLGWTGAHFILLRGLSITVGGQPVDIGLVWVILALTCAWIADTGAYFVGRSCGKHKMMPHLSPNKTWEGYLGGLLGGILVGGAWPWLAGLLHLSQPPGFNLWHSLAIGALVAMLTPLGDLGESMIKRWANVKDSGHLIPGHGGMFDRLDSLLWAAVIVYYYAIWVI